MSTINIIFIFSNNYTYILYKFIFQALISIKIFLNFYLLKIENDIHIFIFQILINQISLIALNLLNNT